MKPPVDVDANRVARLAALLEGYMGRLREGVPPDSATLIAENPDLADELRAGLANLEFLQRVSVALEKDGGQSGGALDGKELGDFRILREVGRGGMGVVYEAEQITLGRRVALKVLPFAAVLDPQQLQRFRNEAHAAAQLHHTHIVPVFSVGCERGVHYYAMQYIEGESLAEAIKGLRETRRPSGLTPISSHASHREPGFVRMAARLGAQAADALDHAHRLGIVHRDVKPGNLLVDAAGDLWVTDFGAARWERETTLTCTGDLVGTLRYMSPEQALGKRAPIDHRTDVYSLGVTLYELLTLEPAVRPNDSRGVLEEIASRDLPSPRRLNPAVPPELETILLKATWKDPSGRYATAQDMADDLRRYLEDQPIQARRPTVLDHASKWARRHRRVVATAGVVLLLAVAGMALALWRIRGEERRALHALGEAQANLTLARKAVDQMVEGVGYDPAVGLPVLDPERRSVLEQALRCYPAPDTPGEDAADARGQVAHAHLRRGEILSMLGDPGPTLESLGEGRRRFEDLVREVPGDARFVHGLAVTQARTGMLLHAVARHGEGRDALRDAVRLRESLRQKTHARTVYDDDLAALLHNSASWSSRVGDYEAAVRIFRRCLEVVESPGQGPFSDSSRGADYSGIHCGIGRALKEIGRLKEAETQMRAAIGSGGASAVDAREGLGRLLLETERVTEGEALLREARADRRRPSHAPGAGAVARVDAAGVLAALADRGDAAAGREAAAAYRATIQECETLTHRFPAATELQRRLAECWGGLGEVLQQQGDAEGAEGAYRQCLRMRGDLAERAPDAPAYADEAAGSWNALGNVLVAKGERAEAVGAFREAIRIWSRLAAQSPSVFRYSMNLAGSWNNLAGNVGEPREDDAAYRTSIRLYESIGDVDGLPVCRQECAQVLFNLGQFLADSGRADEAEAAYRRALDGQRALARKPDAQPSVRANLVDTCRFLAQALEGLQRRAEAEACFREGEEQGAALLASSVPRFALGLVHTLYNFANFLGRERRAEEAVPRYERAAAVLEDLAGTTPSDPEVEQLAAYVSTNLALALEGLGRTKEAEGAWHTSVSSFGRWASLLPDDPSRQHEWATRSAQWAQRLLKASRPAEAEPFLTVALQIFRALVASLGDDFARRGGLANGLYTLSTCLRAQGRADEATLVLEEAVALLEELERTTPSDRTARVELAAILVSLAGLREDSAAVGLYRRCLELDPNCGLAWNALAWTLATSSDTAVLDAAGAVRSAEEAIVHLPLTAGVWNTLGVARYRAADWEGALFALRKSVDLGGTHAVASLFLAMAYEKLGVPEEARAWFARAGAWIDQSGKEDADVIRFQEEARQVLGLSASHSSTAR